MTPTEMRQERERFGLTQQAAALKLGVSQPYLSLLEAGSRRLPVALAKKVVQLYGTSVTALPLDESFAPPSSVDAQSLADDLAGLGYPGFTHFRSKNSNNPAAVLFNALGQNDLESRLVEALPWVMLRYPNLNWEWLVPRAKLYSLQNRLGYLTHLARQLAERNSTNSSAAFLAKQESMLENSRLAVEGTLCHDSLSPAERNWLRKERPQDAAHWNLLTDVGPQNLRYGNT